MIDPEDSDIESVDEQSQCDMCDNYQEIGTFHVLNSNKLIQTCVCDECYETILKSKDYEPSEEEKEAYRFEYGCEWDDEEQYINGTSVFNEI